MKYLDLILFKPTLLVFALIATMACNTDDSGGNVTTPPVDDDDTTTPIENDYAGTIRDITSMELVSEMGVGWNLGNSFDTRARDKTAWGNPLPSRFMIDAVSGLGFRTLRIPVTWRFHQQSSAPYVIESSYMDEVQRVVNYGLDNKMHVIVNIHHEDEWVKPTYNDEAAAVERMQGIWTQVSERFKEYGDSLIFEVLNEPRLKDSPEEWNGGTAEGREVVNRFNKACVDAIRATGGNNEKRHLMVPSYAASTLPHVLDAMTIPNDDPNIIVSQHAYFPWAFAGEANVSWGSAQDKAQLSAELERLKNKWIVQNNRPVILGEWGAVRDNSRADRLAYAEHYAKEATARGMPTIVWDDGGNFQLYDRHSLTWVNGDVAQTIIDASK